MFWWGFGFLDHLRNGSEVELRINGLIDLPVIFQKAAYSQLFDQPPCLGGIRWAMHGHSG